MPGRRTPRSHRPTGRDGLVSIVHNSTTGAYDCYWYGGTEDDRLLEQAGMPTSAEAIAWGGIRTSRVRIRAKGRTCWAGSDPPPDSVPTLWAINGEEPGRAPAPPGAGREGRAYRR